jgi:uncharacterized membrane protein
MAAFLLGAGVTHFLRPEFYDRIVPGRLPFSPRFWTLASGAAELGIGASLLHPKTARRGAWLSLGLFVAVFPANIQDTADHWPPTTARGIGSVVRLPLQAPLVAWAWRLAHT